MVQGWFVDCYRKDNLECHVIADILDGHFFTYICCKNCNDVGLKRPKINWKEAGVGPFFKKNTDYELK